MEVSSTKGVLSHLSLLEVKARSRKTQLQQPSHVKELKAKAEALRIRRNQLKAEIDTHKNLQRLRVSLDKQCVNRGEGEEEEEEEEEMDQDSEKSQLLRLTARHTQLKDLLPAYHIIGGYSVTKTSHGGGVCVSLATAYEGVYLETYNVELNLKRKMRITRHNVPPFIPLDGLVEQSDTDVQTFLDSLSKHLNGFAGRKQQLKLVKELHQSVEVMESNVLCSILVLLLTVPKEKMGVLCTLAYTDHTRCLPTQVHFVCEDKELPDSPAWKENYSLLMETPVHEALTAMRKTGVIV